MTFKMCLIGWDESNATLKLYIDIPRLPPNAVHVTTSDFTSFAVHLRLKIGDKEYCFSLKNLAHEIIPEETNMKLKKGKSVLLTAIRNNIYIYIFLL